MRTERLKGVTADSLAGRFGVKRATVFNALFGKAAYKGIEEPGPLTQGALLIGHSHALTTSQVRSMRQLRMKGRSLDALARQFSVHRATVLNALFGHKPYKGIANPGPLPQHTFGTSAGVAPQLTPSKVRILRRQAMQGVSTRSLAVKYHLSTSTLRSALYGRKAYGGISRPGPLKPRHGGGGVPVLLPSQVQTLRRRKLKGDPTQVLAHRFKVSEVTVRNALRGLLPYDSIPDPPPLPSLDRHRALTVGKVREARRRYVRGERTARIAKSLGVSVETLGTALFGHPPYTGISDPSPPEPLHRTALSVSQVQNIRRRFARSAVSLRDLARRFKVGLITVQRALYGRDAYRKVTDPPPLGPPRDGRSLSTEQVREARWRYIHGERAVDIAKSLGITFATVYKALFGRLPYAGILDPPPPEPARGRTLAVGRALEVSAPRPPRSP